MELVVPDLDQIKQGEQGYGIGADGFGRGGDALQPEPAAVRSSA